VAHLTFQQVEALSKGSDAKQLDFENDHITSP
jgi:hypothetical protein